ncbi:MAG: M1 family metallopeptidase [Ignavibacteriales bacterium]|nr:M1 family metallopeptidase [Ignavibacteriales bacterium]
MKKSILILFALTSINLIGQFGSQDSGGKLLREQACYDVKFYDINLTIDTDEHVIGGFVIVNAEAVTDFSKIIVDLDTVYNVESVSLLTDDETELDFIHSNGKITINFPGEIKKGNLISLKIVYAGMPRTAKNPPWDDGFIWKTNKDNLPWASVTCQGGGADIWLPCKDHPSDEPDSVSIHFTVPKNLTCISNGKFIGTTNNNNGTQTWNWFVSTPINNYNITFYLGGYKNIEYDYTSIAGEKFPFTVWVLPENYEKAKVHSTQFVDHMKVMEELIGPYPFRADKYAVVEAPHLGMEHQTAIAYGFGWKNHKDFPFDWLHHHEFSHEWWGNLVTNKDWSDFWIHEGLGTYMQPLYLEKMFGKEKYFAYLKSIKHFSNKTPIAPREEKTAGESYTLDVYYKGGWMVHTLRYYLGDEIFFKVLRRWAYPTEELEKVTNGKQCRFATTDEMIKIAEDVSGKKLDWFFEVYLRNAKLPVLNIKHEQNKIILWWETENDLPFILPVDVKIAGSTLRVEMNNGKAEVELPQNAEFVVDPNEWILMDQINIKTN